MTKSETINIDNDLISIRIPEHLRIGQALYVFLCWLTEEKMYPYHKVDGSTLADTFNIPDADIAGYYNEWLKSIEQDKQIKDGQQSKENTD